MPVTETLAAWAAGTPDIRATGPLSKARDAVLDTVGCMIAGAPDEAARAARRTVSDWGEGRCTVIGQSRRLAAPWAAMANGTAAHALDFDDSFAPVCGHASAVMVPALLALAESLAESLPESRDMSGHALLDAYIVGLEIQARIGQAVNLDHYRRGWHSTSTVTAIGAAAACARLIGLDTAAMVNAISIGVSTAAGSKRQFGTMVKPLHAGLAAKNAVMAATLAAQGITGNREPLDGDWGFRDLFAGPASPGFDAALGGLGAPLAIEQFGLTPKIYPCCASTHRSLDGLLELRAEHGLSGGDVTGITTHVPPVNFDNLPFSNPEGEMEKRFSMPYCLATAMIKGAVILDDFRPGGETPADVSRLMPKVDMRVHDGPVTRADPAAREATIVEVHLTGGRTLRAIVENQKGHVSRPLAEADYKAKFSGCLSDVTTPDTAARLHRDIMDFDRLESVTGIMNSLRDLFVDTR